MKSLKNQMGYAIQNCFKPGVDKHAMKEPTESGRLVLSDTYHIFSFGQKKVLSDLANQLMSFIRDRHPDIKWVRDIKVEHINEFLASKADCSTATLSGYATRIRKLELCANRTFKTKVDWHIGLKVPKSEKTPDGKRLRTQHMTIDDFDKIMKYIVKSSSRSKAPVAWELTRRFGLRVQGAASITTKNAHLDIPGKWGYGQVDITEKGGRHRDIDIMTAEDRAYIETLIKDKKPDDKLVGIKAGSINKALNRAMVALGLKEQYPQTGEHSIRKLYAQSCWNHCRAQGMSKKEATRYVNQQLGHAKDRDSELLRIYVKSLE